MSKARVFVAVYASSSFTDIESTTTTSIGSRSKAAKYHWGIWIEPKGSEGEGTSFDIEEPSSHSYTGASLFGLRLQIEDHKTTPPNMLGRLMIGKIPDDATVKDIGPILNEIPLPGDPGSPIQDNVAWIKAAIIELQEASCAERFFVDQFIKDAVSRAKKWESSKSGPPKKVNYTRSRTFP
jgi:hypothetical protein